MHDLRTTYPDTWNELVGGRFSVSKNGIPSTSVGPGHACEHLNRQMKVNSGLFGISNNVNARKMFFWLPQNCHACQQTIGLYRDVWIAAIASSRKSLATQTAAICVRFHGRRVRHVYVTMQITFLARKSALIYRRGLRQRVASLTIDCNGVFAIRAYRPLSRRLDRCDRVIQQEPGDPNGGNMCSFSWATGTSRVRHNADYVPCAQIRFDL